MERTPLLPLDSDGAFHRDDYEFVVVYDPDGGFVTGAGWIDSPAGALMSDPDAEGRAMFGFTSKYRHGAGTPDGNTMFRFRTGDLSFRSTSHDWLVVTGGDTARFKGSGTINGELSPSGEPYRFLIWADDGADDSFRIKIWTESDSELVVYDNASNQPIGASQVVVQS